MSTQPTAVRAQHRQSFGHTGTGSLVRQIVSNLTRPFRAIATQYRMSRDIDRLKSLSDETLRDIGIHRSEIMSLVHEMTHGGLENRHARN